MAQRTMSRTETPLRLVLQLDKRVYRASESIQITGYLENNSTVTTYYIGRELGGFCSILSFHYIELRVTDQNNKNISIAHSSGDGAGREGTSQREKIEQEYIPLAPKAIHKQTNTCEIRLKKVQYRMQAIYHESEATDWKTGESLNFPVWTKTLYSNVVRITVIR
jgi:hypothetical protein